jgi:hypothetical protein
MFGSLERDGGVESKGGRRGEGREIVTPLYLNVL